MANRKLHIHGGHVFGRLTVESVSWCPTTTGKVVAHFNCLCACGIRKTIRASRVIEGKSLSCGCLRRNDLIGQRFGRLLVVSAAGVDNNQHALWHCERECKKTVVVVGGSLQSGNTTSCGCWRREVWHAKKKNDIGQNRNSKEYNAWKACHQRCYNPNNPSYRDYGACGIRVCSRWSGSEGYLNFLMDMGRAPSPAHSLDRYPDPAGDYEPANCRWATHDEQARNKRKTKLNKKHEKIILSETETRRKQAYSSWSGMKQRCRNPRHHQFYAYGAAGITVCQRWNSFNSFLSDMGLPPGPGYTIDRFPDKDGNYEPGNCRWATKKEQATNRKTTLLLQDSSGRTMCLSDWAQELGLTFTGVKYWINKGKTIDDIIKMEHR